MNPTEVVIDTALVTPAAEAVREYLSTVKNGEQHTALLDEVAKRLLQTGKSRASSDISIKHPGIRSRFELLEAGGDEGLRALIVRSPGRIEWSGHKEEPLLSATQRERLAKMLVGTWRSHAPIGQSWNSRWLGLYGIRCATFNVNLETTLKISHHDRRNEWVGRDDEK